MNIICGDIMNHHAVVHPGMVRPLRNKLSYEKKITVRFGRFIRSIQ